MTCEKGRDEEKKQKGSSYIGSDRIVYGLPDRVTQVHIEGITGHLQSERWMKGQMFILSALLR